MYRWLSLVFVRVLEIAIMLTMTLRHVFIMVQLPNTYTKRVGEYIPSFPMDR